MWPNPQRNRPQVPKPPYPYDEEEVSYENKRDGVKLAMHALGRIGEASDVASAMEWLLDPAQAWSRVKSSALTAGSQAYVLGKQQMLQI